MVRLTRQRRDDLAGAGDEAGGDVDVVGAGAERDGDDHRPRSRSAATIARTVASCGVGLLLMWICASA